MAFTPTNRVYLLDIPFDNTNKNQLYFSNKTAQQSYFKSRSVREIDNIDYIKKENKIVIEGELDDHWNCNYVMYQNTDFNNKWFYAFITKMEWESERSFSIYIETDVYQTWFLDCELLQSFTVREHVASDVIGEHIVDEGIEYGEYKLNSFVQTEILNDLWFVLAVSDTVNDTDTVIRGVFGNVYSGLAFFAYAPEDYQLLSTKIDAYIGVSKGDAIQFIFTIPKAILPFDTVSGSVIPSGSTIGYVNFEYKTFSGTTAEVVNFKRLDDYTPTNKKLYCYPYNTLYISNNNGASAEYHFEDFYDFENSETLFFWIEGNIAPNPTIIMYPLQYKTLDSFPLMHTTEYGLQLSGYPFCSWGNDTFNAWMAQNAVSTAVTLGASTVAIVGGAMSGNAPAVVGGVIGVASQMAQLHKASLQPDQAKGNTNGGSLNIATYRQNFSLQRMSIRKEYAERIDNYLTMYGYKVNTLKVPETHSRTSWNYVQTIDVNIKGSVPTDDMHKLKQIFNDGVTLWHDADKICNYYFSNPIV